MEKDCMPKKQKKKEHFLRSKNTDDKYFKIYDENLKADAVQKQSKAKGDEEKEEDKVEEEEE